MPYDKARKNTDIRKERKEHMKYTSAQVNKLIKKLQEEHRGLLSQESRSCTFVAATVEDLEAARPAYSYGQTQSALAAVEQKIRLAKHALNVFNATHTVPGFPLTVDEMLIYLPQLNERKMKLSQMANVLAKTRLSTGDGSIIEYEYANYDLEQVRADLLKTGDELIRAQLALDRLNQTELMEIPI